MCCLVRKFLLDFYYIYFGVKRPLQNMERSTSKRKIQVVGRSILKVCDPGSVPSVFEPGHVVKTHDVDDRLTLRGNHFQRVFNAYGELFDLDRTSRPVPFDGYKTALRSLFANAPHESVYLVCGRADGERSPQAVRATPIDEEMPGYATLALLNVVEEQL